VKKAEYPSASCREPVWGVQAYSCELADLHPGPHATFSQPTSVKARDAWEAEHPGWESQVGKRDVIIPPPVKSLPDLPRPPAPEQTREEFVEWANGDQRDKEIKALTVGEVLESFQADQLRLRAAQREANMSQNGIQSEVAEAYATANNRVRIVLELLQELRFGWGIELKIES
jgi:hypothetical protein